MYRDISRYRYISPVIWPPHQWCLPLSQLTVPSPWEGKKIETSFSLHFPDSAPLHNVNPFGPRLWRRKFLRTFPVSSRGIHPAPGPSWYPGRDPTCLPQFSTFSAQKSNPIQYTVGYRRFSCTEGNLTMSAAQPPASTPRRRCWVLTCCHSYQEPSFRPRPRLYPWLRWAEAVPKPSSNQTAPPWSRSLGSERLALPGQRPSPGFG